MKMLHFDTYSNHLKVGLLMDSQRFKLKIFNTLYINNDFDNGSF